MANKWIKFTGREKRHRRIRRKISGTSAKPRLSIYRSISHMYVQLVDDTSGKTLLSISTVSKGVKDKTKKDAGNVKGAVILGEALANACKGKGITDIVFDRSGYLYHGRVKALADAARKGGLKF